jgi:hypothetical protein
MCHWLSSIVDTTDASRALRISLTNLNVRRSLSLLLSTAPRLRYEIWKRDEAGRQLHCDVDSITLLFTQSLAGCELHHPSCVVVVVLTFVCSRRPVKTSRLFHAAVYRLCPLPCPLLAASRAHRGMSTIASWRTGAPRRWLH